MLYRTFSPKESFILPDEGTHAGIVSGIAFLGQHERKFMERVEIVDLIGIHYQLAPNGDGQAAYLTEELPLKTSPKANLVKRMRAVLGKDPEPGFRYVDLLGKPCVVAIEHREWNELIFANVGSVSPAMAGQPPIELVRDGIYFDPSEHQDITPLPRKWQKKIMERLDADGALKVLETNRKEVGPPSAEAITEDSLGEDIPF